MKTATRKRATWTVAEWRAFCLRCQSAAGELHGLIHDFPETSGVNPAMVRLLIAAQGQLFAAMLKLENLIVSQHYDLDNEAISFVHGSPPGRLYLRCTGRVPRDAPPLSREQWATYGAMVKAWRRDVGRLAFELQAVRGGKPIAARLLKLSELSRLRCKLDSLVYRQHPGWRDFSRVFYGETAPDLSS